MLGLQHGPKRESSEMPVLPTPPSQPPQPPDAAAHAREVLKLAIRSLLTVHCAQFQPTQQPRPLGPGSKKLH